MYVLRKWYFDYLKEDGEYAYVYFAYIRLAGRTIRSLTVHVAFPGALPVTRSFLLPGHKEEGEAMAACALGLPCGEIRVSGSDCSLQFERDDCSVNLSYSSGCGMVETPVEIVTGRKSRIIWTPVALRYTVSGTIRIGGTVVKPGGASGYADALESTCLPPLVPARTLYWGRAHHTVFDMAYVHAVDRGGESICSCMYLRDGAGVQSGPLTFEPDPSPPEGITTVQARGDYLISGTAGGGRMRARVHRMRPVQEAGFIDQQDVRSPLLRSFIRLVTRDPRGTKYLSRADVSLILPGGEEYRADLALIDECVRL